MDDAQEIDAYDPLEDLRAGMGKTGRGGGRGIVDQQMSRAMGGQDLGRDAPDGLLRGDIRRVMRYPDAGPVQILRRFRERRGIDIDEGQIALSDSEAREDETRKELR